MDPLSVSASAITIGALAVQTVSTIKKAHDLYSAIKDAPENLRSLLEELQLLSTLLASFTECARPHHGSGGGLVIALAYCKDTLESIQTFSIDLENAVLRAKWASRQWTALKITFQERKLKGHLNRLERAKSLLSLAHQICMQSQMVYVAQLQQRILSKSRDDCQDVPKRLDAHDLATPSKPCEEKSSPSTSDSNTQTTLEQKRTGTGRTESEEDAIAKKLNFEPTANGLLGRGLSLLCERSLGRWQYSLRTFSTFTTSDPIFHRCVSGDLIGVQQLCSEGRASPFDVTHGGFTLLHIAATYAHVDICRWLLDVGVDADSAARSRASADHRARFMVFEAGATPLHLAAQCSGRRRGGEGGSDWFPDAIQYLDTKPEQRPKDCLDTIRLLIERGGDPMAVDIHGDTALHLHTGAIEEFQYLLRQKGSVVDCSQVDHTGDTIAERHARWYWARGPERSRLALEHENGQKRLLCGYGSIEPSLVPVTSKTLLLHETVAHLRYFYRNDHQDLQSGLTLIRQLLAEGVDIHCLCNHYSGYSKTPLAQIPRLTGEVDIGPKGLDEESKVTSLIIQAWLGLLRKANVDLDLYIREEEKLIRSKGIDLQWEYYEDNLEWEYCINWDFGTMTDDNPDRISVEYIFRPVSQESREPDKFLDKEAELDGIPGAWIEDS